MSILLNLDHFKSYLNSKKLSPLTIKSYILDIKHFLEFDDFLNNVQNLKIQDFRRYISHKKQNNIKPSSISRCISAIKAFYKMLKKYEICNNDEILKFTSPKLPKTLPKALTIEEVMDLFLYDTVEDDGGQNWENQRNKAIITLIYSTGLRISEALSLKKRDYINNSDFIKVLGKGNKERVVPLVGRAKNEINKYLKISPIPLLADYPLFIKDKRNNETSKPIALSIREFQKIMQNIRTTKNLPKFATPHALRHSFATHIISKGGDIRSVQSLLGHSSLSTTQKYVKVDEEVLKEAYNKFHNFKI
jgi:integrase/recombinase XerC